MDNDDLFDCFDDDTVPAKSTKGNKGTGGKSIKRRKQDGIKLSDGDSESKGPQKKSKHEEAGTENRTIPRQAIDGSKETPEDTIEPHNVNVSDELNLIENMPRIQVHQLDTLEACTHEMVLPPGVEFEPLKEPTEEPAKSYPFILDPFQKEALKCLENNQSVLVSAHTSAGKTVVAEYAVAMSLRDKQRVIYTTPIKALSNQKYREFSEEFQDVGLMTGDATINPTASCLIMTTEILRSMLYRGSEVMREVAWVIFDEIHYMRDKERGVVWEETIILLPNKVHYVFLSATIPNARQFAEWVAFLHKQPCHVVYTEYRPTPLQHYIFPAGGNGIYLVVDEKGNFLEDNFSTAMNVLKDAGDASKGDQKGKKGGFKGGDSNCYKLVKMIMERDLAPVIIFSFSKKDCEAYALAMSKLDFNDENEKNLVEQVFNSAIDALSDEDKELPQVKNVLPLLKRGIGIHHSGLLPLLKETIEILFGEGLIKALFATETFAMGLNMPARTVMYTSARKFDGKDFRWITSGEYIQMSGRAGRRGKDDKGIVILMVDEKMSPGVGKQIIKGQPDYLNSAFHLTYNMVLNLLRVEGINPEYMLERSFYQFQNYASIPQLYEKLKSLEASYKTTHIENEEEVASYYRIRQQLHNLGRELEVYIQKPAYLLPFLQPGRLVKVEMEKDDFGWGVVVNFQQRAKQNKSQPDSDPVYIAEVLLYINKESVQLRRTSAVKPCPAGEEGEMVVVPIQLHLIKLLSAVRLYTPNDLRPLDARMRVYKSVKEVEKRFKDGPPLLDPIEDMGIKEKGLKEVIRKIEAFEQRLNQHPLHNNPDLDKLYKEYQSKAQMVLDIKEVKAELKKKQSLLQMDELKCRKRVLRRLGYCNSSDVIEMKGRVACEISSADELLISELLFNDVFGSLTPAQCNAVFSAMVFQESGKQPQLTEQLSGPLRIMQDTARRIAKVSKEARLEVDEEEYVQSFKPHMMDVVHAWSNGASFSQICKMTDVFEGSVIRCMRRLEETLRQMVQASKAIGNTELENKFTECIRMLKRDIVFAASLYL